VENCDELDDWRVDVALLGDTGVFDEVAKFVEGLGSRGVVKETMTPGPCCLSCTRDSREWLKLEAILG
jgi:hypothetical protein